MNALEMGKHAGMNVTVENAGIKNQGKMHNPILIRGANVGNQGALRNIVSAFRTVKNAGHNVNVRTVAMENEC